MPRTRPLPLIMVLGLLVSACAGGADPTDSASPSPTPSVRPTPTHPASTSPEATRSPTEEPTQQPTDSPSPTLVELPGGFTVHANAEADSLFLDRDTCSNERDNYEVAFPDEWYTNTEIGRNPACVWFSPTDYDVPDPSVVPDEIAITIEWVEGDIGRNDADALSREDVLVGGQNASRVEWNDEAYWYTIQLGPSPEEGPNLLVATSAEMGGDYELNKAVMDRMMATIEFFGSVD
jgi:hypothetical protein